jgi:hypothetical protein
VKCYIPRCRVPPISEDVCLCPAHLREVLPGAERLLQHYTDQTIAQLQYVKKLREAAKCAR